MPGLSNRADSENSMNEVFDTAPDISSPDRGSDHHNRSRPPAAVKRTSESSRPLRLKLRRLAPRLGGEPVTARERRSPRRAHARGCPSRFSVRASGISRWLHDRAPHCSYDCIRGTSRAVEHEFADPLRYSASRQHARSVARHVVGCADLSLRVAKMRRGGFELPTDRRCGRVDIHGRHRRPGVEASHPGRGNERSGNCHRRFNDDAWCRPGFAPGIRAADALEESSVFQTAPS